MSKKKLLLAKIYNTMVIRGFEYREGKGEEICYGKLLFFFLFLKEQNYLFLEEITFPVPA